MRVDEIRRELVVEAPIEQVWEALTTPEHLSKWFGDSAEIDLRPAGRARFGWSEFNDSSEAIVEVVGRPFRFSFRWEALPDTPVEQASTLVEFSLESVGEGTRLTLVESGFAALPEDAYDHRFRENSSGWTAELKDLSVYLAAVSSVG
ncbi:MAG: SRPBCC domain-containing protein [Actinobacteria bacterium]|nr:SRPBCC domain-containing protein [Actinomycetota bacterium]